MAEKTLSNLNATAEESVGIGPRREYTGRVELRAIPDWLKGGRFVTASLSPQAARGLAIDLLKAADRAEAEARIAAVRRTA